MQLYSEKKKKFGNKGEKPKIMNNIVFTAAILLICTVLALILHFLKMFESNVIMIYLCGILFASYFAESYIFSITASICAVLLYNFFFTMPYFTFKVNDPNYIFTFITMFLVGFITSWLTISLKLERQHVKNTEEYISLLYNIEKKLLNVKGREELAKITAEILSERFNADVVVGLFNSKGEVDFRYVEGLDVFQGEVDIYAKQEAYRFGRTCGRGTDIYPGAKGFYKALVEKENVLGVIGISMKKGFELTDPQYKFIDVIAPQVAVVLQREINYQNQQMAQMEVQKERLRTDMLRSISHDFRTPLAGVMGLASTALENYDKISDEDRKKHLKSICEDAEWLNELVENILQATRFEEGTMKLDIDEEAVEEIVSEAMAIVKKHGDGYKIHANLPEEMIFIKVDGVLIRQVLVNLLNNAINYSPSGSEIELSVRKIDNRVIFELKDNGFGIPDIDLPYVFDRYRRSTTASQRNEKGLGLGLSLCKSIVEAHNGEISIRKNNPKGTIVSFYIPAEKESN
ncbi:MAG: ATP-binding protein [Solirubrobacterales bacterium]